jgi:CRP-like cAMP-binding protein
MLANIDYTVICVEDNSEIAYLDKNALDAVVDDYGRIVQRAKMQVKYISG